MSASPDRLLLGTSGYNTGGIHDFMSESAMTLTRDFERKRQQGFHNSLNAPLSGRELDGPDVAALHFSKWPHLKEPFRPKSSREWQRLTSAFSGCNQSS